MATTEETLSLYEEIFSKRFTSEDSEFMKTVNRSQASPPCITEWISSGYRDRSHSHNSDSRTHDRPRHDSGRDYGRRYGDRYGSDRHGSYNRDDRYGGRHPDRRDDRGHRGYDDRGDRQKPATEYGSRGFYEYFY